MFVRFVDQIWLARISPAGAIRTSSDDDRGPFLTGRSTKRRKPNGLNGRMSRMLLRAETSYVGIAGSSAEKRGRALSNSSSSSIFSNEVPRTPIDAIHNAVKRDNLGDGFSVIKMHSSPDRGRPTLFSNNLPSWRDAENKIELVRV